MFWWADSLYGYARYISADWLQRDASMLAANITWLSEWKWFVVHVRTQTMTWNGHMNTNGSTLVHPSIDASMELNVWEDQVSSVSLGSERILRVLVHFKSSSSKWLTQDQISSVLYSNLDPNEYWIWMNTSQMNDWINGWMNKRIRMKVKYDMLRG